MFCIFLNYFLIFPKNPSDGNHLPLQPKINITTHIMLKKEHEMMLQILQNQSAISKALGIDIPYPMTEKEETDPFALLPEELRNMLDERQIQVFRNAFMGDEPLFSVVDGTIRYNLEKQVLAAYFFGRLFCGDHPERCIDIDIWRQGANSFPNALIAKCFGNMGFRESRQNKLNKTTPQKAHIVDMLFEDMGM